MTTNTYRLNELRTLTRANESCRQPLGQMAKDKLNSALSMCLIYLFPPAPKLSMCKYYGHVVDMLTWVGEFPPCSDCGKLIRTKDELRGASVKGQNADHH